MVSLCGLALSSFFVINNQKLVHADSLDNGAAAMSFDDDSASNNSAIKADDLVQNKSAASDGNTNNVQNLQSSNLNCEQNNNNSAQVHYNADGVQSINPAQNNNNVKVANVNDAASVQPIVIDNPVNNQVHVHFVTTNGQLIDQNSHDYNIDINQSGQGRYQVPANYQLANGNGVYSTQYVSNKMPTFVYSGSMSWDLQPDGNTWGHNASGGSVDFTKDESQWLFGHGVTANAAVMPAKTGIIYDLGDSKTNRDYPYDTLNSNPITSYMTPTVNLNQLAQSDSMAREIQDKFSNAGLVNRTLYLGYDSREANEIMRSYNSDNFIRSDGDYELGLAHFEDKSGSAKQVDNSTVNVILTKPQSVDPATNSRLNAEAMRTIKINFPGSIPPSYKNIVDDKGVLTQTVKFTRTGQEDMLTGNLIESSIGPWQSNNSDPNFLGFPERTLPRIPGYTLSIKPA